MTAPQTPIALKKGWNLEEMYTRLHVEYIALPRYGWIAPTLIVLLAGALRFWNLAHPNAIVFDETYYVKDGYSLLHYGYERNWSEHANETFVAGTPTGIRDTAEYVVHPPVGKWMIAFGMALFGDNNPFGWRFAAALTGTLSVGLIAFAGWLIFRSVTVASLSALLLGIDGLAIVQSRLALLDIFLMFWLLATFVCLLLDREQSHRKLAQALHHNAQQNGGEPTNKLLQYGPKIGIRPWRILAGICAGLAVGTKWNALFFIAIYGVITVLWDNRARQLLGIKKWWIRGIFDDGIRAFLSIIGIGLLTYISTWSGWFLSENAYHRHWAEKHPTEGLLWLPPALRSLWEYHVSAYSFHIHLDSPHTYQSPAWQWLILGRPTSYYYESLHLGENGCPVAKCSEAILNIGNPLIWWSFIVTMALTLFIIILKRDWRFLTLWAIFAIGYFPWFAYPERTMFFFYALSFEPYAILLLAGTLGLALGRPNDTPQRKKKGLIIVALFVITALLITIFYLPIWTAEIIPYEHWRWRMWFNRWI
ncbi:dolichyl-phosphate-mannose--protein mannosyltransferase [Rothia sp. P7208]|uniref:dolichyl-phosphate-mannose--protein mannosyltransferase n=1 Tax=Rothia sp. P7208 TaxID=3402660 RepID=UPI003AD479D1